MKPSENLGKKPSNMSLRDAQVMRPRPPMRNPDVATKKLMAYLTVVSGTTEGQERLPFAAEISRPRVSSFSSLEDPSMLECADVIVAMGMNLFGGWLSRVHISVVMVSR